MKTSFLVALSAAAITLAGGAAFGADDTTLPKNDPMPKADVVPKSDTTLPTATPSSDKAAVNDKLDSKGSFATEQAASDWRSSKLIGLNVYNSKNEKIGDINDLIVDAQGKVTHAIVGVGGFLGLGEKNVALDFKSVKFSRDTNGKAMAMVDSTKEALSNAPAFKFYSAS